MLSIVRYFLPNPPAKHNCRRGKDRPRRTKRRSRHNNWRSAVSKNSTTSEILRKIKCAERPADRQGINDEPRPLTDMTLTRSYWSKLHLAFAIGLFALASQIPLFGNAAPAWELKDVNGNAVKLSDFKGKVVILDFWATWCPPCRAEIPHFVELQDKYGKQGLVIVGISLDEGGPGVVSSFVKANKMNYPIVMGNLDIAQQYGATDGIPTTFVIDRKGNIVSTHLGFTDPGTFESEIKNAL